MENKIPLSVVVLAKNESARIRDCLRSVDWADEVLVVDDHSTDDTARTAEAMGARVVRRAMDIEGRHRNWAHAQAKHEWIFSVDADERVTPELAQEIIALFRSTPAHELYAIPRRNYLGTFWIRHGGWYPSPQLKLFKKSVFRWEETTVHPRAFSDRPAGQLTQDLIHYSYRDRGDFLRKLDRQTTLEAEKWAADGRRMSLGKALWRAIDRVARSYVLKRGYRDGAVGWFVARMAGRYQWVSYWKYVRMTSDVRAAAAARLKVPHSSAAAR
ncbi:MAG: glycosyltransferase family 2 protein [Candidatus Omnitrophica bacterium]|nr:glycosyltransferase family 2 protein [Candidatus Omnitrophota bacterium]